MAREPWIEQDWWEFAFGAPGAVAVIGAGGKTTALRRLAKEAARRGANITLTTSTMMAADQVSVAERHLAVVDGIPGYLSAGSVLVTRPKDLSGLKLQGLDTEEIDWLAHAHPQRALVIEADGGRAADLKVPGDSEPVIPACVGTIIAVTSLGALDSPLNPERVHRWSRCVELLGCRDGEVLSPELMARLLSDPQGTFSRCDPRVRRLWLVNKADSPEDKARAEAFINVVVQSGAFGCEAVAYGSLAWDHSVFVRNLGEMSEDI